MSSPGKDLGDLNSYEQISRIKTTSSADCPVHTSKEHLVKEKDKEFSVDFPRTNLQNATSTTNNEAELSVSTVVSEPKIHCPPMDPSEWSVDDVMHYLVSVDSGLSIHAQLFQKHVCKTFYEDLVHFEPRKCFTLLLGN